MSGLLTGFIAIACLILLLAFGVPVAFAMGLVAIVGMYLVVGEAFLLSIITAMPWSSASTYTFVVIPMFIFMGAIAARAGFIEQLYTAAHRISSRARGSLFYATILASSGFAAISGSTIVSSSIFTRMALPQMIRFGYDRSISAGCIAAAGTLAALIPPSIVMVLYGILTNTSIGRLLIAGIVPGLMTAVAYMVSLRILLIFKPDLAPVNNIRFTFKEQLSGLVNIWSILLVSVIVLGGIYSGLFSPSSAGAIGAAGVLIIAAMRRRTNFGDVRDSLFEAARITAVLFAIIIAGLLFSRFLTISSFIAELNYLVVDSGLGVTGFMLTVVAIFIVLGMFVDTVSMLVLTLPFLFPISKGLGLDPVWFGIIVIKLAEIGAITPPVGLNLFAVVGASKGSVSSVMMFRGVFSFLVVESFVLFILIMLPELSLWLPNNMMG